MKKLMSISSPLRRLMAVVADAVSLAAVVPAAAAACTPSTSAGTAVFSKLTGLAGAGLIDTSSYFLAPGGSFESGTSGWTLSGASVVSGNDTLGLSSGSHSLSIPSTSSPISAPFCVSASQPTFRFAARALTSGVATINTDLLWTDSHGISYDTPVGVLAPSTSWSASPVYNLGRILPTLSNETYMVRLQFKPGTGSAPIALDDLYIDPYNRG